MRKLWLGSYGCQMNERDSEEVLGMLTAQGYEVSERPDTADVILLNTCSVREHAEERAFGKMGELSALKRQKPDVVLGIIGCMAKLHQERIFKRLPSVDLIAGPAELYDLPYLLAEIQERRQSIVHSPWSIAKDGKAMDYRLSTIDKVIAVNRPFRPLDAKPDGDYRKPGVSAFVTIMEGCDKACTYCIVPKTRGQEVSRPAEEIIREINALAASGYQEVTLLGQNVNSYGKRFPDGSGYKGPLGRLRLLQAAHAGEPPEIPSAVGVSQTARGTADVPGILDFPQLLRLIDCSLQRSDTSRSRRFAATSVLTPLEQVLTGLKHPRPSACGTARGGRGFAPPTRVRIRFTTSHPFDANVRLFEAMRECRSVCEWLHLPVQSGSNRLLRAMRRGYTREAYLEKIEQLRRSIPDISLSTDIIVGFPGERDDDFQQTASLMREVEYDNAYIFKYSPRPGTDAAAREDDVPREVKEARNQALLALQDEVSLTRHRRFEDRTVEVLIEGAGKREGQLFGRTRGNHGVIVDGEPSVLGQTLGVRITRATARTLFGVIVSGSRFQVSSFQTQQLET